MEKKPNPEAGKPSQKPKGSSPTNKGNVEKKGGNKGLVIFLAILIVALLGASAYLFMELQNTEQKLSNTIERNEEAMMEKNEDLSEKEQELSKLLDEYTQIRDDYAKLGMENMALEDKIKEIESTMKKYRSAYYKSEKGKKELEEKIASMQADLKDQTVTLDSLKQANELLTSENETLKVQSVKMSEDIVHLEEQVAKASVLKADDITVSVLKSNGKEVYRDEYRDGMIDKIRVVFNLEKNPVAKQNEKILMLRITNPQEAVMFDSESGGGTFEKADGTTDYFTMKQALVFDNTGQEVSFIYSKGEDAEYKEGVYGVELYAEGHKIGETEFIVK